MTYSIGDPHNPQPTDPRFPTQDAAELAALERQYEWILAVWDDVTGEVLALVWDGAVYRA
jgi:hypothetical protein